MVLNYDALKNVSKMDINVSRLGIGEETPENIRNYVRDTVGSTWMMFVSFALFIMLVAYFNQVKQYAISQSTFLASIFTFLVTLGFTLAGFTKNIQPLLFWGTISIVTFIWVYTNKKKGLEG